MVAQTRAWTKPELIVLVRGKPDEAVLFYCKEGIGGALSSGDVDRQCMLPAGRCQVCNSVNDS